MTSKRHVFAVALVTGGVIGPGHAVSEQVSLLQSALFAGDRRPLVATRLPGPEIELTRTPASLFAGTSGASLFAPFPERVKRRAGPALPGRNATQIERIRNLIGRAEAGRQGYDAVQHGADIRPAKPPTKMTVQEIYDWIAATPGQQHAIGRYQFIPKTLKRLVDKLDVGRDAVFTPGLQDRLGDALLVEAGLYAFSTGLIERHTFMNNLAKIWAGLPTSAGKSHYHGFAGNRATMTWAQFDAQMGEIFPG